MKHLNCLALLSATALLFPLCAFARTQNEHSLTLTDPVKIGTTQLKPGNYKVEWNGTGPAVQVAFLKNGNTVATAPATLRTNDNKVIQDDIVTDATRANTRTLREIDFAHNKEALLFVKGSR